MHSIQRWIHGFGGSPGFPRRERAFVVFDPVGDAVLLQGLLQQRRAGRVLVRQDDAQVGFLAAQSKLLKAEKHADPARAALTDLCLAVFNVSEFVYVQ